MTGMRNLMRPRHDLEAGEPTEPEVSAGEAECGGDVGPLNLVEIGVDVEPGEVGDGMPASLQPVSRETLGNPWNRGEHRLSRGISGAVFCPHRGARPPRC